MRGRPGRCSPSPKPRPLGTRALRGKRLGKEGVPGAALSRSPDFPRDASAKFLGKQKASVPTGAFAAAATDPTAGPNPAPKWRRGREGAPPAPAHPTACPNLAAFPCYCSDRPDPPSAPTKDCLSPPEQSSPYPKTFHEVLHDHLAASARLLPSPGASFGKRKQSPNAALSLTAQPRLPPPGSLPLLNPGRQTHARTPDGRSRRRHQSSKHRRWNAPARLPLPHAHPGKGLSRRAKEGGVVEG